MGLGDWLHKKEDTPAAAPAARKKTMEEKARAVYEEVQRETLSPVITISLSDGDPGLCASKFGGLPYLPKNGEPPKSENGRVLRLLAQINGRDLPANSGWPCPGLLQFWVLDDDCTGLDFDNPISQKDSRVLYYEEVDSSVTEEEVREKYHPFGEEDSYFPVQGAFSLSFEAGQEGMSSGDFRFDQHFTACWNRRYPQDPMEHWFHLPEEATEPFLGEDNGFGHKCLGYPGFTQEDPRYEGHFQNYRLLFQMDSAGTEDQEIMWGDAGICNFFIAPEDLENKDFRRVLYNWDCY